MSTWHLSLTRNWAIPSSWFGQPHLIPLWPALCLRFHTASVCAHAVAENVPSQIFHLICWRAETQCHFLPENPFVLSTTVDHECVKTPTKDYFVIRPSAVNISTLSRPCEAASLHRQPSQRCFATRRTFLSRQDFDYKNMCVLFWEELFTGSNQWKWNRYIFIYLRFMVQRRQRQMR